MMTKKQDLKNLVTKKDLKDFLKKLENDNCYIIRKKYTIFKGIFSVILSELIIMIPILNLIMLEWNCYEDYKKGLKNEKYYGIKDWFVKEEKIYLKKDDSNIDIT